MWKNFFELKKFFFFFAGTHLDKMIANTSRWNYEERVEANGYRVHMVLTIQHFRRTDVGKYECRCRNELGEAEGAVKLHGPSFFPCFFNHEDRSRWQDSQWTFILV